MRRVGAGCGVEEEERSVVRASASRPFLKCVVVVHGAVQTNDSLARFIYHVIVPSGEAWRCVGVFERFWDHRGFGDSTFKIGQARAGLRRASPAWGLVVGHGVGNGVVGTRRTGRAGHSAPSALSSLLELEAGVVEHRVAVGHVGRSSVLCRVLRRVGSSGSTSGGGESSLGRYLPRDTSLAGRPRRAVWPPSTERTSPVFFLPWHTAVIRDHARYVYIPTKGPAKPRKDLLNERPTDY